MKCRSHLQQLDFGLHGLARKIYEKYGFLTTLFFRFRRLKPKLALPGDNTLSADRILEVLSHERRATSGYN